MDFSLQQKIGNKANFLVSELLKSVKLIMKEEINFNGTTQCGGFKIKDPSDIKVWLNWPELNKDGKLGERKSHLEELLTYNLFKKFENMKDKEGVSFK